ncbi:copper amine oxidase-like protein [Gottschalkia acidurici 9a]|uniref:Copper amine oxidase-like protein n=1 Tax=Gottschalkia acidurici (strain ATCC 7906 / DSM 604 / BCRC 14475 / CIP 104303 / KCTC 5404 / NCIMB 10678 / 9a) TaxID=1128398 RepID=K0B003_GOTA9|nr:copper amine oxidase N-terminal domain-containing protein [Gottschalkia acidurici]AFS77936.1 copper amine oxidase-like protein [Gottschalkia acidurici 9a]
MSRVISIFIITILLMVSVPSYAIEESNIITIIDGELVEGGNESILKDSRLIVPLRIISEKLGYDVHWDSETATVKIENAENILQIGIGKKEAIFNGKILTIDVKPFIKNNITYVPLRFISEVFNREVSWDNNNRVAIVGDYTTKGYLEEENYFKYESLENGFSLKIPSELKDKLIIKESKNRVIFYDAYSHGDKTKDEGGLLFRVSKTYSPQVLDIIPGYLLNYDSGVYYIAEFASDVQYDPEDEVTSENYLELLNASRNLLRSFVVE